MSDETTRMGRRAADRLASLEWHLNALMEDVEAATIDGARDGLRLSVLGRDLAKAIRAYVEAEVDARLASMWGTILKDSTAGPGAEDVETVAGRMLRAYEED